MFIDYKINNTVVQFTKFIYVSVDGNDYNDGSEFSPFRTIMQAITQVVENACIIVGEGEFTIPEFNSTLKNIRYTILGQCERTIITVLAGGYNARANYTNPTTFMRCKFIFGGGYDTRMWAYWTAGSTPNIHFHNCLFLMKNGLPTTWWLMFTSNSSSGQTLSDFYNCTVEGPSTWGSIGGNRDVWYYNIAFTPKLTDAMIKNEIRGNKYVDGVTIDSNGNILSGDWKYNGTGVNPDGTPANMGVYGGPFAWGHWTDDRYLIKDGDTVKTIENDTIKKIDEPLNKNTFDLYGFKSVHLLQFCNNLMSGLGDSYEIIQCSDSPSDNIKMTATPAKMLLKQTEPIIIRGMKSLSTIKINTENTEPWWEYRIVLSFDNGVTWKAFDRIWVDVNFTFDDVMAKGNTWFDLATMPSKQLSKVLIDREFLLGVAMISESPCNAGITSIQVVGDESDEFVQATPGTDYTYMFNSACSLGKALMTLKQATTFKITN